MTKKSQATQTQNQINDQVAESLAIRNDHFYVEKSDENYLTFNLQAPAFELLSELTTKHNVKQKYRLLKDLVSFFASVPAEQKFRFINFKPLAGMVLTQLPNFRNNLNANYIKYSYNLFVHSYNILVRVMSNKTYSKVSKNVTIKANIALINAYQKAIAQDNLTRGIIHGPR